MRSLQDSVDRLSGAFDRMADRLEGIATDGAGGPAATDGDKVTRHIRRYMPFYALATVWALMLILIPTLPRDDEAQEAGQVTSGSAQDFGDTTTGPAAAGAASESTGPTNGGGAAAGTGSTPQTTTIGGKEVTNAEPFFWLTWQHTGKTRGGMDCTEGVRQLPWSAYAPPCVPAWTGDNGGATARGVTPKEVVVVERKYPDSANSQAVDAAIQQAGFASEDERQSTRREFVKYFNKTFELWGRQVKHIIYESEFGDSTEEAQSKGKEGACADARAILDRYKPYMVIGEGATSSVFGECAAALKMNVDGSGSYFPESWYQKHHPYLWGGVMECERIAYMNAEYIGKRLVGRPAKWAKRLQKDKARVFGTYVPDNDQYQRCVNIAENELKTKYNVDPNKQSRYNYVLDISRFPDEAAKAIVQFNADGVTTVILACDFVSPIFLTQSARGQEYFPEWVTNSAGLTDVEQFARLYDQESIQWSLFGMSQLGDTGRILGPNGEGTTTYKRATGTNIPPGAQTEYYGLLRVFGQIQAAGPILTPDNMAAGLWRLPPGGAPHYEVGFTSFTTDPQGRPGRDHTSVDDMREIYWLCTNIGGGDAEGTSRCSEPKGADGKGGTYKATYGGRRFRPGQWPEGDPPVFPELK